MLKRFLSLVLAFVMVFSLLPVQALAEGTPETEGDQIQVIESDVTEPEETEPEVTEPEETEPEETEPEETEPEVTEPEETEPEVTEPEVTEPEVTEPEVTEPEVTEPEVTEPVYVSSEETASREARNAATISGTNLTWELTDGVLTISGYGKMTNFGSQTGTPWYSRASEIISIEIGGSVTSIGDFAFKYCSNLRSVDISGSVSSIGESAFAICTSLTDVTIRNGVATIGKNAFTVCTALKTVTLPQSVTTINNQAFEECTALNTLVISSSAPAIGYSVFRYCDALTDVYYAGTESNWTNLENRPTDVTRVHYSCSGPEGHWESVSVDATCGADGYTADVCTCAVPYTKNKVVTGTATGNHDFTSSAVCSVCGQTNNTCGDNLTWELTDGVLTISGTGPMDDFDAATESATPAAPWDERREEITAVVIGENVTAIGSDAFWDCSNMTSIDLPDSLISIGEYAFKGCRGLTSIDLPDSLTTIGKLAFSECTGLTGISLPARLTSLGDGAFFCCSGLTSIEIPSGVTVLGQTMFHNCTRLQRIYLPRTLTSIDATAFGFCSALTDVYYAGTETAWSSVSGIDSQNLASATMHFTYLCTDGHDYADGTCTNCGVEKPAISGTCGDNLTWELDETTGVLTISGTGAMTDFLLQTTPWYASREDITQVVIGNGVTTIGEFAFEGFSNLTDVTISNSVTSIGAYAFCYCESLKTVSIPDSVTTIGTQAFAECTALESICLPSGLTAITIALFCNCSSLKSIELPAGVTTIGDAAFYYVSQLKDVYFAGTEAAWQNISIGEDNSSLDNATMHYAYLCEDGHDYVEDVCTNCGAENPVISGTCGENLTWELDETTGVLTISGEGTMTRNNTYPWDAYKATVTAVVLESGVTSIAYEAFKGCTALAQVTIPDTVTTIGDAAFYGCTALTALSIPSSVTSYGHHMFGTVYGSELAPVFEGTVSQWLAIGGNGRVICSDGRIEESAPVSSVRYGGDSNIGWSIYKGTLYINGSGAMPDEGALTNYSWTQPDEPFSKLVVMEGITSVSGFYNVSSLTAAELPSTLTKIDSNAFDRSGIRSIVIPRSVTAIEENAFRDCEKLTHITFEHRSTDPLEINGYYTFAFYSKYPPDFQTVVRVPSTRDIHTAISTYFAGNDDRTVIWENTASIPVTAITVAAAESAQAEVGLPIALRAAVTPADATGDVVWSVSDPQMGELIADGDNATFTGWKTGTVTVRCASADDTSIYSETELTILPPTEELTGLTVRVAGNVPNEIELGVPTQMVVDFQPGNAAARDVTWELDDGTGSATIDKNGLVTPLTAGTVIVTATSKQDSDIFATRTVEIIRYVDDVTILLDGKENVTAIGVGQEMSLSAVASPADAKYQGKDVVWTLENGTGTAELLTASYPATVCAIRGKTAGTVILTATSPDSRQCYARLELEIVGEELPYAVSGGNIYYNTRTGFITRADSSVKEAVIPSKIGGTTITGVAPSAFTAAKRGNYTENTTLTYVKLPDTVTFIGEYAFNCCTSLATLKLGSGVTTIGKRAFYYCESISNLEIPNSATAIGSEAFYGLSGLKKLTLSGELNTSGWLYSYQGYNGDEPLESITFTGSRVISQPHEISGENSVSVTHLPGRSAKKIIISDSITAIEDFAFHGSDMQTLSLGSGVTAIGRSAFNGCDNLTSVTLPECLTSIGMYAFYYCNSLTSITVGDNASIGMYAFYYCNSLTSITVGDNASIGMYAFCRCDSLTSITVGDNTSIGERAFSSCGSLTTVTVGDNASIGKEAFYNSSNLTTVTIGDNASIGEEAFASCHNLVTVNLPDNLTHVGKDCFRECPKLQLFDLSRIPDVIIAKETPLDNMATVPTALVSATGGKVSLYWNCNLADIPENEGREPWEVAQIHSDYNRKNTRLVACGTGTIILSCTDEYTGARGSKEVRIETGIEVRGVPAYLVSGKSVKLTAYRMPDNKTEAVYWSLDTEGAKYAKLSTTGASAAVTLTANAATVTSAKQVQLTATPTGGGDEVVVSIWLLPETSDVLIFAGNPDAPADHDALNGETLDIDMHAGDTLQLSALVKPTGALNEVSWKSSAATVAAVDENGLVTLKKPGTVTITATATDGSKESASVKLNVIYLDTVSKLTATVNVPAIGLQPKESATMLVYGEDKAQPLDPKNLTFTIPASQQDIAKVEDGVITAKDTAGTATVTAAITGDPLGRSVSVKVKVIPSQAVSLQLTPELPASDRPVDMDEQNGTYAIGLNTRDAKGQAYTFTIRPKVANSLGETFTPAPSELNWATTDSRIATVLANNDGSATVTVNADADGACAITATTTDAAQVESELVIYVRDYTPRLESTTLVLNTYLESGASIGLLESYDHYIDSVSIHEYDSATGTYPDTPSQRLSADYADGLLTVTASEFIKNGTIKTQLRVTCDKGRQSEQTHIFNLSVKAASTLPAITVKQPVKFNTKIGTQTALTFTAKNAAVLDVQLDEETSESFLPSGLFDEQTGSLLLDYIPGDVLDTKVEVDIYVDGYRDPIRKAVTIGTTTAMPSVTVKQPAKLNLFYTDSTADLFVTAAGAAITDITLDEESTASFEIVDSFDPDTGKLTIGLTGDYLDKLVKLDASAKLLVELEGYTEPIAKTFTIGTVTTKPALSLTATSSIINTAISCEPSTEFAVYNKTTGENLELDDGDVSTTSNFVEISVAAENRVKLTLTGTAGGTADVSIQKATWTQPVKLSHKITVQTARPVPVSGTTTLKLNRLLPDISAQTTMKLNQSNQLIESINFTPIGAEAEKIQLSYADGIITAAFDPAVDSSTLKDGTCRFSYEVTLVETTPEGEPITLSAKTLLVNVSSAAPKVSLSAKGKLDTMNPDSEILYTVNKLSNISGYIDGVELAGEDSELFSAELDTTGSKPVVKLIMAAADQYATNKTYKMQLVFTVRQSDEPDSPMHDVAANISFKVSQSAVKFAAVPAGKLYQFQDSVSYTVALTTPSTATLEDITLDTGKTAAAFLRAMGNGNMMVDIAADGRSAVVTFEINSPAYLTYGKSYTVYVNAEPENLSINGKPTQLKLTLKTYK